MNRFIIINELAERGALKSSCSASASSPSACNLLGLYISVGSCILARDDGQQAEIASQRKPGSHLHASGGFSQGTKPVWSNIIKLLILKREKGFHEYTTSVPDFLVDFCNFLMQTFRKFEKQKPGKFLNC